MLVVGAASASSASSASSLRMTFSPFLRVSQDAGSQPALRTVSSPDTPSCMPRSSWLRPSQNAPKGRALDGAGQRSYRDYDLPTTITGGTNVHADCPDVEGPTRSPSRLLLQGRRCEGRRRDPVPLRRRL